MSASAPQPDALQTPGSPLTPDELSQALKVDVYDREGKTKSLGELMKGQRTALIFIRHFCKSARACESSASMHKWTDNMSRVLELSSVREMSKRVYTACESTSKDPE